MTGERRIPTPPPPRRYGPWYCAMICATIILIALIGR